MNKICKHCNKEFQRGKRYSQKQRNNALFCSVKCLGIYRNWKGENASYSAKHKWMYKQFGQPNTCENCRKTKLKGRFIQWANISGKHKRERTDWLRLCTKCHKNYDLTKRKLKIETMELKVGEDKLN